MSSRCLMDTIPIFLLFLTAIFAFVHKLYSSFNCASNLPTFLSSFQPQQLPWKGTHSAKHCPIANKYSLNGSFWYALILIQSINNCGFEPDKIIRNNIHAKARMFNTRSPISRGSKAKKFTMRSWQHCCSWLSWMKIYKTDAAVISVSSCFRVSCARYARRGDRRMRRTQE